METLATDSESTATATEQQADTSTLVSDEKNEAKSEFESCYFEALGEGNSKKLSKKNSAVEILKILKEKFEPLFMISSKKPNCFDMTKFNNSDEKTPASSLMPGSDSTSENNRFIHTKKLRKNKAKNIAASMFN